MDLTVAVSTAAVEEEYRSRGSRADGVTCAHMALGAEPGVGDLKQPVINGSVGLMAVGATLKRWRMRPQEWPPSLGMTGVTVFVNTGLLELERIRRAMRIMAVGTSELSFSHRHVRRTHELGVSLQVTLTANFYFRAPVKERSFLADLGELRLIGSFLHYRMAIHAS
jgi:hypothetical protein